MNIRWLKTPTGGWQSSLLFTSDSLCRVFGEPNSSHFSLACYLFTVLINLDFAFPDNCSLTKSFLNMQHFNLVT